MEDILPVLKLVDTITSTGLLALVLVAVWQYLKWQSSVDKERVGAQLVFLESLVQLHREDISKMNAQHRLDMKEMQQQTIGSYDKITTQMTKSMEGIEAAFISHEKHTEDRLAKMLVKLYERGVDPKV